MDMGCGHSKIHLYPRKSKSKGNGKKSVDISSTDGEEDEAGATPPGGSAPTGTSGGCGGVDLSDRAPPPDKFLLGPLLPSAEMSSSQLNFFRMLDDKIENGRDYNSDSETEIALEESRMNALVQHWESASLSASACSSSQGTPVKQPLTHRTTQEIQIRPPPVSKHKPFKHQDVPVTPQYQNRVLPELKNRFGSNEYDTGPLGTVRQHSFESPNQSPVRNQGYQSGATRSYPQATQTLGMEYLDQRRNYVINVLPQSPVKTNRQLNISPKLCERSYNTNLLPQSVIHQSYGVNMVPSRQRSVNNSPHSAQVTYYSQQSMARIGPDGLLTPTTPCPSALPPTQPAQTPYQKQNMYHSNQVLGFVSTPPLQTVYFSPQTTDAAQLMESFSNGVENKTKMSPMPIRQLSKEREQFFLDNPSSSMCQSPPVCQNQNVNNMAAFPNICNSSTESNQSKNVRSRSPHVQLKKQGKSFSAEMS